MPCALYVVAVLVKSGVRLMAEVKMMAGKQTKEYEPREYRYKTAAEVIKPLPSRPLPTQSCVREVKTRQR